MGNTSVDSGFLDQNNKLTSIAKDNFIKEVIKELSEGSNSLSFPCGTPIPPYTGANQLQDLADEEKYPDFHREYVGQLEKIAQTLNMPSSYAFLPICDPTALGSSLGIKMQIQGPPTFEDLIPFLIPNLPGLFSKLGLPDFNNPNIQIASLTSPFVFSKKLADLITPPPIALNLSVLPKIYDFTTKLPDPFKFVDLYNFQISFFNIENLIKKFMIDLMTNIPTLALKFGNVNALLNDVCKIATNSGVMGPPVDATQFPVKAVVQRVTARMTSKIAISAATGSTLGSSSSGFVGFQGKQWGNYISINQEPFVGIPIRDKIVQNALSVISVQNRGTRKDGDDYAWSTDPQLLCEFFFPVEVGDGKIKKHIKSKKNPTQATEKNDPRQLGLGITAANSKELSSCGLLVRACLRDAGASCIFIYKNQPELSRISTPELVAAGIEKQYYYDFFQDSYIILPGIGGVAIVGLLQAAVLANAVKFGKFYIKSIDEAYKKIHGKDWQPQMMKDGKPVTKLYNDFPPMKRGDVIIVYDSISNAHEHAILLVEDYIPGKSKYIATVEGGQTDFGNPKEMKKQLQQSAKEIDENIKKKRKIINEKIEELKLSRLEEISSNQTIEKIIAQEKSLEESKKDLKDFQEKNKEKIKAINDFQKVYKTTKLEPTAIRRKQYYFPENYPAEKIPNPNEVNDQVSPYYSLMQRSSDGEIVMSKRRVLAILDGEKIVKFKGKDPVLIDSIVNGKVFLDSNDPQDVDQIGT